MGWNANDVTLSGLTGNRLTDTLLRSRQDAAIADFLLYFRNRRSRIRPYLSVGTGFVRIEADRATGASLFKETQSWPLRVAVGIDLMAKNGWGVRYSFSETISGNPFSARLDPPGPRKLANFQNLVGVVKYFGR
ncbi:MAG: hypothetical protein FJW40_20080 [Acidobacteria bacterium]|nr:hypothetical protein [Acidobacteriota bacterium]